MAKKSQLKPAIDNDQMIIDQISALIPQVPDCWMDAIAKQMGKGKTSIFYYTKGRGKRKGYPADVLRYLTALVKKENRDKEILIQKSLELNQTPTK